MMDHAAPNVAPNIARNVGQTAAPHRDARDAAGPLDAANAAPLLSIRDLRVEFPDRRGTLTALDDVSFDIRGGEVLGVVGESGAGKSMTGAAIIGLLPGRGRIAGGTIHLRGERIDDLSETDMRRVRGGRIGTIFQDPLTSLNPLYTVGEQLTETIQTHLPVTEREARDRAVALLEEVGIPAASSRLGAYPHEFSGGMRQRVVIALALCAEPELVIADEPTTALDVSVQAQIIAVIKRLCDERGVGVMLVTHDMGVIAETADRVAVMYAGRVVEIGPIADTIQRPLHPYTEGLMGSIPGLGTAIGADRLVQIPGSMPRLDALPPGCRFHPRCQHAFARCSAERPAPWQRGLSAATCHLLDPAETDPRAMREAAE